MNKKALVILANGFEEIEAVSVIDILRRAGVLVCIAGLNNLKVKGSRGLIVITDKKLNQIRPNFDACILPGGGLGAKNLASSLKVASLINDLNRQGKLIAAICASPAVVLAPLGILDNKTAACYPGMEKYFSKSTKLKKAAVVVDGNILTSRGPATAMAFALAIVEKLCGKTMAKKIKKAILA